jgi:hypothetical protein
LEWGFYRKLYYFFFIEFKFVLAKCNGRLMHRAVRPTAYIYSVLSFNESIDRLRRGQSHFISYRPTNFYLTIYCASCSFLTVYRAPALGPHCDYNSIIIIPCSLELDHKILVVHFILSHGIVNMLLICDRCRCLWPVGLKHNIRPYRWR